MLQRKALPIIYALLIAFSGTFTSCDETITPTDTDSNTVILTGFIKGARTLSSDSIYQVVNYLVVDSLATLNIPAGTILKFNTGSGAAASALVCSRYGTLNISGTATNPVIMTSILDNIEVGQLQGTNLDETNSGLWGGLIILGQANVSDGDGDTEGQIEGIPSDFTFGRYGGNNNTHSSGTITYVSIRHNGTELKPDQELQGLTLAGVGSGTVINHIEVVASSDDGVEIFGGNNNLSDVAIIYHQDDGLDLDQNYRGTISNVFITHEGAGAGNAGFEFDGPEGTTYTSGKFTVQNVTAIANNSAAGRAATLKSGAQGTISNCSFQGYTEGILVSGGSANDNYATGELDVNNCEFNLTTFDLAFVADTTGNFELPATGNTVGVTSFTKGATISEFTGWTWGAANGFIQ